MSLAADFFLFPESYKNLFRAFVLCVLVGYSRLTPNKYPINADITIAIVPQIHILNTDLQIKDPPTFAAIVPDKARKSMENPY